MWSEVVPRTVLKIKSVERGFVPGSGRDGVRAVHRVTVSAVVGLRRRLLIIFLGDGSVTFRFWRVYWGGDMVPSPLGSRLPLLRV